MNRLSVWGKGEKIARRGKGNRLSVWEKGEKIVRRGEKKNPSPPLSLRLFHPFPKQTACSQAKEMIFRRICGSIQDISQSHMYCAQFLLKKHCVLDWLSPITFLFIVAKWWISLDNVKKILLPVVLILQLCMSVQILHTFFNARVPLGLCQIWAWHQESVLYPIGGGEYLTLWAWRVDCEQSLIFPLSQGDREHMWRASGKAAPISPPFYHQFA